MKYLKSYKLFEEEFTPMLSLSQYDVTPEEYRKEVERVNRERNEEIDRQNMLDEITDDIRYDKLSQADINLLIKKATVLRDDKFVRFLKKIPTPFGRKIKDHNTKELINKYLNL